MNLKNRNTFLKGIGRNVERQKEEKSENKQTQTQKTSSYEQA